MKYYMRYTATLLLIYILQFNIKAEEVQFPSFTDLNPITLMPKDTAIQVAAKGHILVNGAPRYLPGTLYYEGVDNEFTVRNIGYPDTLRWLYNMPQDYKDSQRIGFDTVGTYIPVEWARKYNPKSGGLPIEQFYKRWALNGLPLYVDFTNAPWSHAHYVKYQEGKSPAYEAFAPGGSFFPWDLVHQDGRQLWIDMWTYGAKYLTEMGAKPIVYELFNEPYYNSGYRKHVRMEFIRRLQIKYSTITALNTAWHTNYASFSDVGEFKRVTDNQSLNIEWIIFNEDLFTEICTSGIAALRQVDKREDVRACFQPLHLRNNGINLYKANKVLNWVSSSTGGGDFLQGHFLRAIADGKPISDGEMYVGKTRKGFRNSYITEYSRGFNASYIFKWCSRAFDWKNVYIPQKDEDGKTVKDINGNIVWQIEEDKNGSPILDDNGKPKLAIDINETVARAKRCAENYGYMLLNPYGVPTEALKGIMDAKLDAIAVSDLFASRDRGVNRNVAFLYSYPTDHIAYALGHSNRKLLDLYAEAIEYAHIPLDIVCEEQLSENRQNRYKVVFAAGVDGVYANTPAYLEQYVRDGGVLFLGQETMDRNELSWPREINTFPNIITGEPVLYAESMSFSYNGKKYQASLYKKTAVNDEWKKIGFIEKEPVFFEKQIGKGKVYFLNAKMDANNLSAFLADFLSGQYSITPTCTVKDAFSGNQCYGIEVTKAQRGEFSGYIICNRGYGAVLAEFSDGNAKEYCLINHHDKDSPTTIMECKDDKVILQLSPNDNLILVRANREILERRFGDATIKSYESARREGIEWFEQKKQVAVQEEIAFPVDPNHIVPIDIRMYANRGFEDRIAGDGKGGWTDQGEMSLRGTPWGIQMCNGVPMDFIRVDQNAGKTCIVLGSKMMPDAPISVKGIKVERRVKNLYFLHATAWSGGHSFSYIIHYADGSSTAIPIRDKIESDDWAFNITNSGKSRMTAYKGWVNSEGRGLYIWRWSNPSPDKTILSIDIESMNNKSIPIVVAISAEITDGTTNNVK